VTVSNLAPARAGELHPALMPRPGQAPGAIIEISGLTKRYGRVVAVDALTASIPRASVGLLGANGAGKTTLIKMLLGLTTPTSGSASVLGFDTRRSGVKIREQVGYMPESDVLPPGATAADFVAHMGEMSGLPDRAARQRAADVLYQVGLREERYRLIKGFSTGMKQRVKLAQAIVHDPALVFLDEPTNGMDPQGRDEMLDLIKRIYAMLGIAVVVSSHILEDIERVCDYVVILSGGKLVVAQPLHDLGLASGDITVRVDGDRQAFADRLRALGAAVSEPEDGELHTRDELLVAYTGEETYDLIRDTAAELHLPLRSVRQRGRSLEDIYLGNIDVNGSSPNGRV
jgi:ABC-2 type transport system ATP-binding protein